MARYVQKYSDELKAKALKLYTKVGPRKAGLELGIPATTISKWAKAAGVKPPLGNITEGLKTQEALLCAKRAALKVLLLEKAVDLLERMDAVHTDFKGNGAQRVTYPIAPASACLSYATSVGILIDKFRLENGEVTGRDEVITVDKLDREIEKLEAELTRREPADERAADQA